MTSRLVSLMPASLSMRSISQRKSAHINVWTRSVSCAIGGGFTVTRATFLEPRLYMLTVTRTTLSTATPFSLRPGRNLRFCMNSTASASACALPRRFANYHAGDGATGVDAHFHGHREVADVGAVVGILDLAVGDQHRLDRAHLRDGGGGCEA